MIIEMKKYIWIAALFVACNAYGSLIDVTPGGFTNAALPPVVLQFLNGSFSVNATGSPFGAGEQFFDEADFNFGGHTGWVSQFGVLNGGTYFFTDLFTISPWTTASVWWNFPPAFQGLSSRMNAIWVYGTDGVENLYFVGGGDLAMSGPRSVTADGKGTIDAITFFGKFNQRVPDTGKSITLLGLSLIGIVIGTKVTRRTIHEPA
jgi:hypothetical protein